MAILGKQLTELDAADNLEDGDLLLIRKSGQGRDKSLTKAKLIESIGNSAISGYTAKSKEEDKITLKAANKAFVPNYYEGMKISFISPISTSGIVSVKIGKLPYIELQKYSSDEAVTLIKDEYVEAIYINGIFKQTNNLNTHLVWSNEYVAEAEINPEETMTVYNLTSAIGVKKTHYYQGMSLLFTIPQNSKGIVFVNVDGLGVRKLGESGGSVIAKDIYENHAIMAIYDGKEFIKQKFATIHTKPFIVDTTASSGASSSSNSSAISASSVSSASSPGDSGVGGLQAADDSSRIWDEDYPGDPDDPANAKSPDAIGSNGRRIFDLTFSVGFGRMFNNLSQAIAALINDFGEDGGGHKFALEIDDRPKYYSHHSACYAHEDIRGKTNNADLRWITIFVKNNATIQISSYQYDNRIWMKLTNVAYSPIFNLAINTQNTNLFAATNTHLTFGRNSNFSIEFYHYRCNMNSGYNGNITCGIHALSMEAKYGFTFTCLAATYWNIKVISCKKLLINKGKFTYHFSHRSWPISSTPIPAKWDQGKAIIHLVADQLASDTNESQIFNTKFINQGAYSATNVKIYSIWTQQNLYLKNVICKERKEINHIGLQVSGEKEATLEDCNFVSDSNKPASDIAVEKQSTIILKHSLFSKANQEIDQQTKDGIISINDD